MPEDPPDLISAASVDAAVTALAERNHHHLESMDEDEQVAAIEHWRELALAVLIAAAAPPPPAEDDPVPGPGRAVIVFEDAGGEDVQINASFHPELQDLGDGEVSATPAQAVALDWLQSLAGDSPEN